MHPIVNIFLDIGNNQSIEKPLTDWDTLEINNKFYYFSTITYNVFEYVFKGKKRISIEDMKICLDIQDEIISQKLFLLITGSLRIKKILYYDFSVFLSRAKLDNIASILNSIIYNDHVCKIKQIQEYKYSKITECKEKSWGKCQYNELIHIFKI